MVMKKIILIVATIIVVAFFAVYFSKRQASPVILDTPKENEKISSPLTVSGKARGNWFFEANLPLVLTNWDGLIIAEGYATAQEDWMTEDFVPFEGVIEFAKPEYGERGFLIVKKDNPSGLPEHDDAVEIMVFFE